MIHKYFPNRGGMRTLAGSIWNLFPARSLGYWTRAFRFSVRDTTVYVEVDGALYCTGNPLAVA
jgi:hypothetical protein